ncbi:cytochrome P450 [Mycolicibacterium sp. XJ1819]
MTPGSASPVSPEVDDLLSPAALADPYTAFGALREQEPVHWSEKHQAWIITRYDDVVSALRDPRFSSARMSPYQAFRQTGPEPEVATEWSLDGLQHWMVFKDPPDHMRLRRLVRYAFTARAMTSLKPAVQALAGELLADLETDDTVDIVQRFAYPLTANVIAQLLGVPRSDWDQFKDWSVDLANFLFGALQATDRHDRANAAMAGLGEYLKTLVHRYEAEPADNLVSALIAARDAGDALTHDEVIATGVLLLFAGHETTTNLIGNSLLALIQNPDQRQLFLEGKCTPERAVEELLRFGGPTKTIVRVMASDTTLHDRLLKEGSRVLLSPLAADHDPRRFPDPDRLDLTRSDVAHLQFGFGIHYCLGAPLARLETQIAISEVLRRWPGLELADQPLTWQPILLGRSLQTLPVRLRNG